jgi:hypothetical protein
MSTPVRIVDGNGSGNVARVHTRNGVAGQVVFNTDLVQFVQYSTLAINPDQGIEMAIDASFSGTPDLVHDGIDTVAWTGSNIVGSKATFNSVEQAHSGSASVKIGDPKVNDIWEFDKGSSFTPSNYLAMTLWVYVDSDWSIGDSVEIYGWDTGTVSQIGDAVLLEDYIDEFNFDVWQKAVIPLSAFNFSGTFDAVRMELAAKDGKAPTFFIDDFQMEESGGLATFEMKPRNGEVFFVDTVTLTFIDAYAGTLASNSMPNLSYNKILNVSSLTNGILLSRLQSGSTAFSATIRDLGDATKGGATIGDLYGDGTNAVLTLNINFSEPVRLDDGDDDTLTVSISDDLTGFISFTALAKGKTLNSNNITEQTEQIQINSALG